MKIWGNPSRCIFITSSNKKVWKDNCSIEWMLVTKKRKPKATSITCQDLRTNYYSLFDFLVFNMNKLWFKRIIIYLCAWYFFLLKFKSYYPNGYKCRFYNLQTIEFWIFYFQVQLFAMWHQLVNMKGIGNKQNFYKISNKQC